MTELLTQISAAMSSLNATETGTLVEAALNTDMDPMQITNAMADAMKEIGERFSRGDCFIPELVMAGQIFQKNMRTLAPALENRPMAPGKGKVVLGTVKGDLHDLGVNLVALVLAAEGFEVVNLGKDVPVERFTEEAQRLDADILGLSALLTTTLSEQKSVIEALEKAGRRERVKVMVGGAPTSQEWADAIGADAVGFDAVDAVEKALALMA